MRNVLVSQTWHGVHRAGHNGLLYHCSLSCDCSTHGARRTGFGQEDAHEDANGRCDQEETEQKTCGQERDEEKDDCEQGRNESS